jgi:DNA-binding transcriptional regulator PaaX
MSRLTADGWFERNKVGRNSFYRLLQSGRQTFDIATKHIYGPPASDWTGRFELLLIGNGGDRDASREALKNAGFGSSRHGVPERRTQKMPLNTRRSLTRRTPRGLFGSIGLIAVPS